MKNNTILKSAPNDTARCWATDKFDTLTKSEPILSDLQNF